MTFYRRRLPHLYNLDQCLFLTWRLHDSLPANRCFPKRALTSGQAFVAMDRLLDEVRSGTFYLRIPSIAEAVVKAMHHSATVLNRFELQAFVVMPNHVHLLAKPSVPLPQLTKTLKSFTGRQANRMLGLTGNPFWQEESYDHVVKDEREWERIRAYIEENPVRAGLVTAASDYRWSSAAR